MYGGLGASEHPHSTPAPLRLMTQERRTPLCTLVLLYASTSPLFHYTLLPVALIWCGTSNEYRAVHQHPTNIHSFAFTPLHYKHHLALSRYPRPVTLAIRNPTGSAAYLESIAIRLALRHRHKTTFPKARRRNVRSIAGRLWLSRRQHHLRTGAAHALLDACL